MRTLFIVLVAGLSCLKPSVGSAQFVAHDPSLLRFEDPKVQLPDAPRILQRPAADQSLPLRLQRALDSVYFRTSVDGRYGVTASVIVAGLPQWAGTSGISHPGQPMEIFHLIEAASNTKTFIAATILQLEEEGRLAITDRISHYLPHFANVDSNITIEQLLRHSGGVYDYMNDDPEGTLIIDAYFERPWKRWSPHEALATIQKPHFAPGKRYRYSNSGYTLLGLIVESVTKNPVAYELRNRFFHPLGLQNTFAGTDEDIMGEFTHHWIARYQGQSEIDLAGYEKTAHLSLAWTGGYIVSTSSDLARWSHALYGGKVLSAQSMAKMTKLNTWSDGTRYGLGTLEVPYYSRKFYGHTGRLIGFQSMMFTMPEDSVTVVVVTNSDPLPGDVTPNDYIGALLDEIYRGTASIRSNTTARVYSIEAGRTMKIEIPENESIRSIQIYDLLGRAVSPTVQQVANGARIELDALPRAVYSYLIETSRAQYSGKIVHAH